MGGCTNALGMAVGVGAYLIAIYTTLLMSVILVLLPVSERVEQRARDKGDPDSWDEEQG